MSEPIYITDPGKGKMVVAGHIDGKTFIKNITKKSHFLRVIQGYAIQEDAIRICDKRGIEFINFNIFGENNVITMRYFMSKARIPKDRGHGRQHEISLAHIKEGVEQCLTL